MAIIILVIKLEKIRNKFILLTVVFFLLLSLFSCKNKDDGLRLRIIANSDSLVDQEEKEYVKSIVKKIFEEDIDITINELKVKLEMDTKDKINHTLKIEYKIESFPAKAYKNKFIPSGNYPTILITIGEGEGKNFWTLLYPDFFNISFDDNNEIEYRSYIYDEIIS